MRFLACLQPWRSNSMMLCSAPLPQRAVVQQPSMGGTCARSPKKPYFCSFYALHKVRCVVEAALNSARLC